MEPLFFNPDGGVLFKFYPISYRLCTLGLLSFLYGCSFSVPAGVAPVVDFEVNRYLGRWYEIARLDNRFQRGLEQVTATYSLREDGSIRVENTGWDSKKKKKRTIIGKAKFVLDKQVGHLKVAFWAPLYGSYVIFYLESDYSVALVCGKNRDFFWMLARDSEIPPEKLNKYITIARENGFAVDNFIYASRSVPNVRRATD